MIQIQQVYFVWIWVSSTNVYFSVFILRCYAYTIRFDSIRKQTQFMHFSTAAASKNWPISNSSSRPATAEPAVARQADKEFCERCYQKKMLRKLEKERDREMWMKSEERIVYDPEEPFVDRHIEEGLETIYFLIDWCDVKKYPK